jgi:hypothetical protein
MRSLLRLAHAEFAELRSAYAELAEVSTCGGQHMRSLLRVLQISGCFSRYFW